MNLAFLKLEFNIAKTYRGRMVFNVLHLFIVIGLFFYISKALGTIEILNGPYFPYVASGLAFSYLFGGLVGASSNKITEWRDIGALEGIVLSPRAPWKIYLSAGIFESLIAVAKFMIILCLLPFASGFAVSQTPQPFLLVAGLLLLVPLCLLIGLIGTCSYLLWKRLSLVDIFSSIATLFLSGVYFPIEILPTPIKWLAYGNPLFHGLSILRLSMGIESPDARLSSPTTSLTVLAIWLLFTLIFAISFYRYSEKKLNQSGGKAHL